MGVTCCAHQKLFHFVPVDYRGIQPIHDAAFSGQLVCLKLLLSKGSKIQAVDAEGRNILHKVKECLHLTSCMHLFVKYVLYHLDDSH